MRCNLRVFYDTGSKFKKKHLKGLTVYNTILLMADNEISIIDYVIMSPLQIQ